ncbi:MAG: DUF123 domain-containing protein, partial [Armatimonadia bacterium]|nr:DUF123 domain-containing protein [Armatimonadia bacterium]
ADVVRIASERRGECETAHALAERLPAVSRFGCSDCTCKGHLFGPADHAALTDAVAEAGDTVRD